MSDGSDPYLYPETDVLRNVRGLRNAEKQAAFETAKTAQRTYEVLKNPIGGRFETAHLKALHKHVFQGRLHMGWGIPHDGARKG